MRIESNQKLHLNTDLHAPDQVEEKAPKSLENNTVSTQGDSVRVSEYLSNLKLNGASEETKNTLNMNLKAEDIAVLKAKIQSGFYDSQAVLEKTVDKILDFYSPEQ